MLITILIRKIILLLTEDESHKFVTDAQIAEWTAKASTDVATGEANGLMSSGDKEKLDGIEAGANKYTHPTNHAATMITEDIDHKFVSEAQIAAWNAKADTTVVTTEANGLMLAADKTKLDGIEAGANNYVHPTNHAATMITEDETHRFVTDTEKSTWNNKADKTVASTSEDGLMSAADKTKLDGLDEYVKYSELSTHEFPELQTTSKTIIGAINELKQAIDTLQSAGQ